MPHTGGQRARAERGPWRRWLAIGGLALGLGAAAPVPAGAEGLETFAGEWVRVDAELDDAAREAEIERITARMNPVLGVVARAVMSRRMVPPDRYTIRGDGTRGVIRAESGAEFPVDGQAHSAGDAEAVTSRLTDAGEIEQSWRHDESLHGVTVWRLEDGDRRLVVRARVHGEHFADVVRYQTTYQRVEAAGR